MDYIWLKTFTEENQAAIDRLKAVCLSRDDRLPLLNLPEQPEECDGCLAAVTDAFEIVGILTALYGEKTVEVCVLVHPEYRGSGIGTELLHRLILSTKKIPVFPVAAEDTDAKTFLTYIGKREMWREMLMTLSKENYSDEKPKAAAPGKKQLRVTCKTHSVPEKEADVTSDRQMRYTLYLGPVPIGHCLVTEGCISEVWIRGMLRQRGYGSFLLRTVIRHQFHLGRRSLVLHVTNLNGAACALYRRYGFEVTEEVAYYF
ncbi:MAG: GNAT family N-acetyltransferase [Lachnospiraceae bacterium]|nr:GNAT family N-acetyltransferase [Lachnospiraceae bacterium]